MKYTILTASICLALVLCTGCVSSISKELTKAYQQGEVARVQVYDGDQSFIMEFRGRHAVD